MQPQRKAGLLQKLPVAEIAMSDSPPVWGRELGNRGAGTQRGAWKWV